ncbi:MAG: hypothetical protein DRI65_00160 [Chloroflexota bacterium]|nr:MAG: hypothetical protein DRI65_00160 [Chloroflexota bacterium]
MISIKKTLKDPRIFLFLAPLILFAPVYLTGKALFWGTSSTQFVPWWDFSWRSILTGQLPLWNPLAGMGAPLAANYQSALFYPPTWIYFIVYMIGGVTWMARAISLVVSGHLIWSGLGTAFLLRELKADKFGQTLGGLAFSLSGYLVARAGFLSINAAVAWVPWLMLCLYRLAKKGSGSLPKLVAVLAMLLLAGHAQTAWIAILAGGGWVIFWAVKEAEGRVISNLVRALAGYAGAGVLGVGLCAIQLLPTAEYLLLSQRASEYGYTTAMTYSFWPWRFLTYLLPDLFGNPAKNIYWGYGNFWEDAVYIGLLPIVLAVGLLCKAIFKRKSRESKIFEQGYRSLVIFLGASIFISYLLALGENTVVFPFLYKHVPGVDLFQAPTRYTVIAEISLALLAGLGANELAKPAGKRLYFARLAAAGCFSIVVSAILAGVFLKDIKPSFLLSAGRTGLIGLIVVALFLVMPTKYEQRKIKTWNFLVIGLISLDLIGAGWGLNPGINAEFYEVEEPREVNGRVWIPADVEYELKFNEFLRFDTFSPDISWEDIHRALLPNLPMLQGIEMVNNFDPIVPGYFQEWMEWINFNYPDRQILEMMNVSGIIKTSETDVAELAYLDHDILPVRVVGCAGILNSEKLGPEEILGRENSLLQNVIISADQESCIPGATGSVDILEEKNGYLKLDIDLDQDGWIFWSQSWYPGWIYRVDGGDSNQVFRVNYLFQGAPVQRSAKQIEFIYRPASFIWGSAISGFSLALGLVLLLLKNRTRQA